LKTSIQIGRVAQLADRNVGVVTFEETVAFDGNRHTVLVLDCSQSMSASIPRLRTDSAAYIKELGSRDFVSVIIFSGHGTAKLIAGPTKCTAEGRNMVERAILHEVRPLGTTVFSEPLELTLETVRRLTGEDTVHNAVLFTDGCAVPTRWDVRAEHKKALDVAVQLNNFGAVVSVVGYGVYYDQQFVGQLMAASGNNGVFRHISEMTGFRQAVQTIRHVFDKTVPMNLVLSMVSRPGNVTRILRVTPEVSGVSGREIRLGGLFEGKATFFVELDARCDSIIINGSVNGKPFTASPKVEPLSLQNVADYIRIAGAWAFLTGDRTTAAAMLRLTGDEVMVDKVETSYSDREQRETSDALRRHYRDKEFIGAGLKPTGPSHCVLNVIRVLIEDPTNKVFIPAGAYERSGELTVDPRVIHPPHGRTLQVVGYSSDDERFNFGMRCLKDVFVVPESGSGKPLPKKIWRTYNLVLDGNLHLGELQASMSEETFDVLRDSGVIATSGAYRPNHIYTVKLGGLRLVSSAWAQPATLGFVSLLREEADLKIEQTALNAHIKAFGIVTRAEEDDIYPERGVKDQAREVETYTAPCVEIRLMGYKAKPAPDCSSLSYDAAVKRVKEVRHRLIVVRYLSRSIRFAMETTHSKAIPWSAEKLNRFDKYEQTAMFGGAELKRVAWTETFVCS